MPVNNKSAVNAHKSILVEAFRKIGHGASYFMGFVGFHVNDYVVPAAFKKHNVA